MSSIERHKDQIELYIQGKLEGQELRAFEDLLESDLELKEEVNSQLSMKESYRRKDVYEFYQSIKDKSVVAEKSSKPIRTLWFNTRTTKIAASLVVVLGTLFAYYTVNLSFELAQNFKDNPPFENTRSTDATILNQLNSLIEAGDYESYLKYADEVSEYPEVMADLEEDILRGKAYALIGLEKYDLALDLVESNNDCYSIWVRWYCKEKQGDDSSEELNGLMTNNCKNEIKLP